MIIAETAARPDTFLPINLDDIGALDTPMSAYERDDINHARAVAESTPDGRRGGGTTADYMAASHRSDALLRATWHRPARPLMHHAVMTDDHPAWPDFRTWERHQIAARHIRLRRAAARVYARPPATGAGRLANRVAVDLAHRRGGTVRGVWDSMAARAFE